jgi:hypothetical protein
MIGNYVALDGTGHRACCQDFEQLWITCVMRGWVE